MPWAAARSSYKHDLAFSESVVSKGAPVWAPFFCLHPEICTSSVALDLCVRHGIDQVAEAKKPCTGGTFRTACNVKFSPSKSALDAHFHL